MSAGLEPEDFEDEGRVKAWLKEQTVEGRCLFASRAALRVVAAITGFPIYGVGKDELLVASLRAILIATCRAALSPSDTYRLDNSAKNSSASLARAADSYKSPHSEGPAVHRAAISALSSVSSVFDSNETYAAIQSASISFSQTAVASFEDSDKRTFNLAFAFDSRSKKSSLLRIALWSDFEVPSLQLTLHRKLLAYLKDDSNWSFWRRWYAEMWNGTFRDWDLAIKVAKLPDHLWEGDDALSKVAAAIRELDERLAGEPDQITPEDVPPENVIPLFDRAPIVQASMTTLSETVRLRVDAFSRLARPNEEIAFYETLKSLPETADKIAKLVGDGPSSAETIASLAQEVGRLRAQVDKLNADLKAAHAELDELRQKPWFRKGWVLVSGAVVGSIANVVWNLAASDVRLEQRAKNLCADFEFATSEIWCEPEDREYELRRFELPDIEDV